MAWSYTPGGLTGKDRVRRLIGDVSGDDPLIQDEEIEAILSLQSNVHAAAAECARAIAAEFARDVSLSFEGTSIQGQVLMQHYLDLAKMLDDQAASGSYPSVIPMGDVFSEDVDPIFEVGMHDSRGPVYSPGGTLGGGG